ncbi:MAG: glycosyltransferase [Pyrinomonadaceae bacterium]
MWWKFFFQAVLRVAFFTDSYLEVNGVALTSKRLESFAHQRDLPFLTVYAGAQTNSAQDGSVKQLGLKRSLLSIPMDAGLAYDPLFQRHTKLVKRKLEEFRPDVIHITGLNDVSILGAWLAHKMQIPILASWHTNLHEFAATRLQKTLRFVPTKTRQKLIRLAEQKIFDGAVLYYKMGKVVLAPNQELVDLLHEGTGREARLMLRGVDTETFSPAKRTKNDQIFRLGFCGRLQPEKNVRLLADLEKGLIAAGKTDYEFLIIGDGSERAWLEQNLKRAEFTGFIEGEKLSAAYANMDAFIFPSETDTFGNVIQEAFASCVPAIVSSGGGPKFIVEHGKTGFVAGGIEDFVSFSLQLINNPLRQQEMRRAAREFVLARSWDSVFESVYQAYDKCREIQATQANPDITVASLS